jgi:hypothetical protein
MAKRHMTCCTESKTPSRSRNEMMSARRRGKLAVTAVMAVVWLGGCGPTTGTQAHDMSAAEHRAAAEHAEAQGTAHMDEYDPNANEAETRCKAGLATNKGLVCWKEAINPTREHTTFAEEQRTMAAQHRAGSDALLAVEEQSCAGIREDDRDISPFAHRGDIVSVSKLEGQTESNVEPYDQARGAGALAGARVVFRAVPGLTTQWLQHTIDCHVARNGVIGHDLASREMSYCPLTLRGVQAKVRPLRDSFAVDVLSEDRQVADEIWRRAQALTPAR